MTSQGFHSRLGRVTWRDLETARRAATGQPPFYDVAVYHCQQAAEKAVKAFFVHHGKSYEKTHDIEVLAAVLRSGRAASMRMGSAGSRKTWTRASTLN